MANRNTYQTVGHLSWMLCTFLLGATAVDAATYYVATHGSNSNPGTLAAPFATISKGVSMLRPGDTLYVRGGTYAESLTNNIPTGTSWQSAVTVAAFQGETVTLRPNAASNVIHLEGGNKRYINIEGFILDATNVTYNGVNITWNASLGTVDHIRIANCEIKNAPKNGLIATSGGTNPGHTLTGSNVFVNLKIHDVGKSGTGYPIYLASSNNLIENGEFYNSPRYGLHIYNSYGGVNNNIIRNNKIYNNGATRGEPGMAVAKGNGNLVYNNLLWGNAGGGIYVDYDATNTKVYNNVLYDNRANGGVKIGQYSTNAIVRNNIVYRNIGGDLVDRGQNTVSSHNLTTDPIFVNASSFDFRIKSGSPAIDRGMALPNDVPQDFAGTLRPRGNGYDIGAFEGAYLQPDTTPPNRPQNVQGK